MSVDTKALNEAADTFARSWNALSAMEAAGLPPQLDQDARVDAEGVAAGGAK